MSGLTVSVSPHIRCGRTTRGIMLDVVIALTPALIASAILFGWRAPMLTAISVAVCVLTEYSWERLHKQETTIGDCSAIVTGMLLAFNVPSTFPVWELIVGDIAAIAVVKMLFGGIGRNFVNPALVGRIILSFSFTSDMNAYAFPKNAPDVLSSATPLAVMDKLNWSNFPDLLLGRHGDVIGCACALALIAGGIYLIVRGVIKPIIPLSYIGAVAFFTWIFGGKNPILSVFAGGLLLGAIFMATDYTTSPFTNKGKLIYGLGCGLLTAAIRRFSNSAGGVSFAILLMNLLVPYINDATMHKPFGGVKVK